MPSSSNINKEDLDTGGQLRSRWCMLKAKEALRDYDAQTATNYLDMALMWQQRELDLPLVIHSTEFKVE